MVLNDAGVIGYSLNGKSFPATEPLVVGLDDWFVVHYYNEGLQIHPMHLHGFPQLVFSKDGYPLDSPTGLTLSMSPRASAIRSWFTPMPPGPGCGTATSSTMSRATKECSGWSQQ